MRTQVLLVTIAPRPSDVALQTSRARFPWGRRRLPDGLFRARPSASPHPVSAALCRPSRVKYPRCNGPLRKPLRKQPLNELRRR